MKHLRESFEDSEWARLAAAKEKKRIALGKDRLSWHDFIMTLTE